ncbi:MAG: putative cell wall-binding domain [Myxococcales bacterium]|nr:putative cell wall-binding domain [Myxococcales bacterium]
MLRKLALLLLVVGCSDKPTVVAPTNQADLMTTLQALAAMGAKEAGTPAGMQAATYIEGRFRTLGLSDIHRETFGFPQWQLVSKSLTISIDGVASSPGFDVFEAAGSGNVDGPVVDVGTATDADLVGVDLTGKVALVRRDPSFHRSSQLRNVTAKGAAAMLYLSVAPQNLRQVGSVRLDWEAAATITAVTVGADDAATIKAAVTAGKTVRAQINVVVNSAPGIGSNVVARIEGDQPDTIVLGAHYDTWFTGSSDNGSGVAELLAVALRRTQHAKPRYTIVFVAYDGEEIGLYGGYDYLHEHKIIGKDPILAFLNLESPSANNPDIAGLVHSNQPKLDDALQKAHLRQLYGVYAGLEVVAQLFGGIIPTDIQGAYRTGVPTVTTAVTNPYYHTMEDTPDKVDLQLLADSADAFDTAIDNLMQLAPADLALADPQLWTADVTTSAGSMFAIDVMVRDGARVLAANAHVTAAVLFDDFSLAGRATGTTDANGHVQMQLAPSLITMGTGKRFLHVTAGPTYPLAETILVLP